MHEFRYKGNELYCEGVKISRIAKRFDTPLYIYSRKTLIDHYRKIKKAFSAIRPLICFSVKANSNLAVLKVLANQSAGMDVVSGGELYRALKVGVAPQRIVYAGVGKREQEIALAIKAGILLFNAESFAELGLIERAAGRLRKKVDVSLRINPDVEIHTHRFITTGRMINKFGLDIRTAEEIFLRSRIFSHLNLVGVHIHIGSQITEGRPFVLAIKKALHLIKRLKSKGVQLKYFNIGGGLGIVYRNERPQTADEFAQAVLPLLKETKLKIILEPGRFIAGNSGILLTKVVYVKKTPKKNFAIVDAGMNDLIRPALYGAYHEILPVVRAKDKAERKVRYDVVGPICESGDFLAQGRDMPIVQAGDLLAVMSSGAYGFVMSSNYNSRPRVAEVLIDKNKVSLVRKRESYRDLIRAEVIPKGL
ncbi:MAG: diaminopimelate decarboxylase [Candidatus Omnitrophota bacterium]|nr:MAG: diaminopimelate decarboxylase [Candidatus Omnitrophota bacterium]